jgi:type III secretion protein N (ATPase)
MTEAKRIDVGRLLRTLEGTETVSMRGSVVEITGLVLRAAIPEVAVGELVEVVRKDGSVLLTEAVGFRADHVVLMPLGSTRGVAPDSAARSLGAPLDILCGPALRGRILDGLGQPIDGGPPLEDLDLVRWSVHRPAPDPLSRPRIRDVFSVGVRAIDALASIGVGQRVGLFAGSGVGKSCLLGQIARGSDADITVICLVGERGRELRDFVEGALGPGGLEKSVVVCATSDAPALVRLKSAFVGTAIAEFFRDQGARVLLLMDSVTRVARAQREVGLAAGEPPTRRGYPPSVFSLLPRLLERTGQSAAGSITAIYSVLVEGGDMEEPIADELRANLDGHVVLSRQLAARGHFPAIDVLASLSRLMNDIVATEHVAAAAELRRLVAVYESKRDLVLLDAYKPGSDHVLDDALELMGDIEAFLSQGRFETSTFVRCVAELRELMG